MGFNNGLERRKFEDEWKKLRVEYAAAGMEEAAVEELYQFDLSVFNSNRRYEEHRQDTRCQQFADDGDAADEGNSALLHKFFDAFSVMPQYADSGKPGGWVDEIESESLYVRLRQLAPEDIELLTLYVFEGYNVKEIAAMKGIAHQNVSKKIRRIKKFLKKI